MADNTFDLETASICGYTESEVKELLKKHDLLNKFDEIKEYYGGYCFCKSKQISVYNPHSINSLISNKNHGK